MALVREEVYIKELLVRVLKMLDTGVSSGPSISNFVLQNKGSLITTNGEDDPAITAEFLSGPDDYFLISDSTQEFGLRWSESGAPVDSVNGKTGIVVLDASDINQTTQKGQIYVQNNVGSVGILDLSTDGFTLTADSTQDLGLRWGSQPPPNVTSVNGQDGVVVLNLSDVDPTTTKGQLITYATTSTVLNIGPDGTRLQADNNEVSGVKWGILQTQPVLSVNGKTGVVVLTYDEIRPTSIKGDLLVYNGFNNIAFPVGTDDQILTANNLTSAGIQWETNNLLTNARKSIASFAIKRANFVLSSDTILNNFNLVAASFDTFFNVSEGTNLGQLENTTGIFRVNIPGTYYINIKFSIVDALVSNRNITLNVIVNNNIVQTALPFLDDPVFIGNKADYYSYSTYVPELLTADQLQLELIKPTGSPTINDMKYTLCIC